MQPLHDRMPVIPEGNALTAWRDLATPPSQLQAVSTPLAPEKLEAYPVTKAMGHVHHDGPDCLDPLPSTS